MPKVATQTQTVPVPSRAPSTERLLLIGPIAPPDTGPGIKNTEIITELTNMGHNVRGFNTLNWTEGFFAKLGKLVRLIWRENRIIISTSTKGRYLFATVLFLASFVKRDLRYVLLPAGGSMADEIERLPGGLKQAALWLFKRHGRIYPETTIMMRDLSALGLDNLMLLPNPRPKPAAHWQPQAPDEVPHLVFLSRVTDVKGVGELIEAVDRLREQHGMAIKVDFYGEIFPPYHDTFTELVAERDFLRYCGVVDRQDVMATLAKYQALVFPSYYYGEGVPGVLVEAALVGTPVISSNFAASGELLEHGVNGLIVRQKSVDDLVEAIKQLLTEPGLAERLSKANLERSKIYELSEVTTDFVEDLKRQGWLKPGV